MKVSRALTSGLVSLVLLLVVAFMVIRQADEGRADLPELYEVPDFTFTERSGKPFGLADMKGKINIVDFIFTRCPGPCPMMSSKMADLYEIYRGHDQVQFVSFTVDPDFDSLAVLEDYAGKYGVNDQRWVFLRANKPEVGKLYEEGFKLGGELPAYHSTKFILVDDKGMIRGYYSTEGDVSINILKTHIKELVKRLS